MRKRINNSLILAGLALCCIFNYSCDDFLDKNPDNRADLDSPDNIAALLGSAYPDYSSVWFTEVMSDNVTDVGPNTAYANATTRQAYYWERITNENQDTPDGYWFSCYRAIAHANQALQSIKELEKNGYYKKSETDPVKGEALLCRAYAHFMLVNLFAEHFDPATAETASGIAYVTEVETRPFVEYPRLSVEEVYELIAQDIEEGFPLISDKIYGEATKWHFNRKAAAIFASRYYLYRGLPGDWDKVIDYTDIVLENSPKTYLRDWLSSLDNSLVVSAKAYSRSNNQANILLRDVISSGFRGWRYRYTMSLELIRDRVMYGNPHPTTRNIENRHVFSNSITGISQEGCFGVVKYIEEFKRNAINVNYGVPYIMLPLFVAEEALFNQIEAEILRDEDYTKELELLNTYYSTRIVDYDPVAHLITEETVLATYPATNSPFPHVSPHFSMSAKQKRFLECVINIRATEFLNEGQRWFDIKRMHIPVRHEIYGVGSILLEKDDPRRVIPLPQDVGNAHSVPENIIPQDEDMMFFPIDLNKVKQYNIEK